MARWLRDQRCRHVTSDLDIVVLTPEGPVRRRSLHHAGWPVGLFVHTDASLGRYCANDIARRQPSLPRMIADGLLLHDRDGAGDSGAAPPDGS